MSKHGKDKIRRTLADVFVLDGAKSTLAKDGLILVVAQKKKR
jgi:hypothetical protein